MSNTTLRKVAGQDFETYIDTIKRGTFARNMLTQEVKQVSWSGYINRDITVRKAIAEAFNLSTFRK